MLTLGVKKYSHRAILVIVGAGMHPLNLWTPMQQLTPDGLRVVNDLAQRHGFSHDAVTLDKAGDVSDLFIADVSNHTSNRL